MPNHSARFTFYTNPIPSQAYFETLCKRTTFHVKHIDGVDNHIQLSTSSTSLTENKRDDLLDMRQFVPILGEIVFERTQNMTAARYAFDDTAVISVKNKTHLIFANKNSQ